MSDAPDDEPRSFRLSRGPSDLWALPVILGVLLFSIVAPIAYRWMMRTVLVVAAVLFLRYIVSIRRRLNTGALAPLSESFVETLIKIGVLGVWIWCLSRAFIAGEWLDAGLASILVAEVVYFEWLTSRRGRSDR